MGHHLSLSLHKIKHMLFSPTVVVDSHSHPAYMLQHKKSIHDWEYVRAKYQVVLCEQFRLKARPLPPMFN